MGLRLMGCGGVFQSRVQAVRFVTPVSRMRVVANAGGLPEDKQGRRYVGVQAHKKIPPPRSTNRTMCTKTTGVSVAGCSVAAKEGFTKHASVVFQLPISDVVANSTMEIPSMRSRWMECPVHAGYLPGHFCYPPHTWFCVSGRRLAGAHPDYSRRS